MPSILKRIRCSVPCCESCQREELRRKVYWRLAEAGIKTMHEDDESEVDDAVWDEIDAATGVNTREIVQRIIIHAGGDYCFMYPYLTVDVLTVEDRVDAERSGAEVTWDERSKYYSVRWKLPECGLFSRWLYRMEIDKVPWKQLRRDTVKYATDRNHPKPKGDALLRCMKDTARHQYSNYEDVLSFHKSLARPFNVNGVTAVRSAYNEEIERIHPDLKPRN